MTEWDLIAMLLKETDVLTIALLVSVAGVFFWMVRRFGLTPPAPTSSNVSVEAKLEKLTERIDRFSDRVFDRMEKIESRISTIQRDRE